MVGASTKTAKKAIGGFITVWTTSVLLHIMHLCARIRCPIIKGPLNVYMQKTLTKMHTAKHVYKMLECLQGSQGFLKCTCSVCFSIMPGSKMYFPPLEKSTNDFELGENIGSGITGVVLKAMCKSKNMMVALKKIHGKIAETIQNEVD